MCLIHKIPSKGAYCWNQQCNKLRSLSYNLKKYINSPDVTGPATTDR